MNTGMSKEANVKLGISISRELAEETDALAREMGVTRSRLYSLALRDFVRKRDNARLLEKLDDAYGEPDPEDEPLIQAAKSRGRRLLD